MKIFVIVFLIAIALVFLLRYIKTGEMPSIPFLDKSEQAELEREFNKINTEIASIERQIKISPETVSIEVTAYKIEELRARRIEIKERLEEIEKQREDKVDLKKISDKVFY